MEGLFFLAILIGIAIVITITIAILISGSKIEKPTGIGLEIDIDRVLKKIANHVGGMEFHDLLFSYKGRTVQIDNVLLTRKALYVIEAKDYSGYIFGSQWNTHWTQVFTHYKARTAGNNYTKSAVSKYRFYNPIKQNQSHINVIDSLTKISKIIPIYNIVVFSDRCTLRDVTHYDDVIITHLNKLNDEINYLDDKIKSELDIKQQANIVDTLVQLNIKETEARQKHIDNIKSYHKT